MERHCPRCQGSPKLTAMATAGVELDLCTSCHGLWLDSDEWTAVFGREREAEASGDARATQLACPTGDGATLEARTLAALSDLEIDTCGRCGGTWLDGGEMSKIRAHYRQSAATPARELGETWSERVQAGTGTTTSGTVPPDVLATVRPHPRYWKLVLIQSLIATVVSLGILLPLVIIGLIPTWIRYVTTRYKFDDEGVGVSWGFFFRHASYLTYGKIQDIHLNRGLIERWLELGTVEVQTASGSATAEVRFFGVTNFDEIRDYLYDRMRGAREQGPAETGGEDDALQLLGQIRDEIVRLRGKLSQEADGTP